MAAIFTPEMFTDFVFRFEFTMTPGANNGLAIRSLEAKPGIRRCASCRSSTTDTEQRVIEPRQFHGSAYGMAGAHRGYLRESGEWNYQEVKVEGSTIQVELNGVKILDTDLSEITEYMADRKHPGKMLAKGHLGFAGHGDEHTFQFRRLSVKKLK